MTGKGKFFLFTGASNGPFDNYFYMNSRESREKDNYKQTR